MRTHSVLCYKSYSVDKIKNRFSMNSKILKELFFAILKMTTRSQKGKAVEELNRNCSDALLPLRWQLARYKQF